MLAARTTGGAKGSLNAIAWSVLLVTLLALGATACSDGAGDGNEPTCTDGIHNGSETAVDCGGADCDACPSCSDGAQNGNETGVDCGGADCDPCPGCTDGAQNGNETGVDCGGADCDPCPSCTDGTQNGSETGVDCGGECADCPAACGIESWNGTVGAVEFREMPVDWTLFTPPALPWAEVPPWTVQTGQATWHTFTTAVSWHCQSSGGTFDMPELGPSDCEHVTGGHTWFASSAPGGAGSPAYDEGWRRDYYGVYSAHIADVGGSDRYFAVIHGEHKNYVNLNGVQMQSVIDDDVLVGDCPGLEDGDCWDAYAGFVGLKWAAVGATAVGAADLNDVGPILWPEYGYRVGGVKSSTGLRHPHGFVHDGWLYVYYLDQSADSTPGGVHVARALIADAHIPGSFRTWDGANWNRSLPTGFDKTQMYNFLGQQGGASQAIIPNNGEVPISFAVARRTDGLGFLGVEEYVGATGWGVRLRHSTDLINWSAPVKDIATAKSWLAGPLKYPVFWAADGSGHEAVDPLDFWIHGTDDSGSISRVRVACN